ncbi:MAG: 5-(carboxyamino)imidazole ribonucleotide mutase [Planctomycetes bacterium]|nr:5-(carboxyamino)imidazole ribonucleotide mutase [Phycisphaerae bacterium]NBB96495.1 5-(carboxyamino)imidazole ribonucleotide mutase [Planctomycetota bacterium]
MAESGPLVTIVMGSKSDLDVMSQAAKVLEQFGISHEMRVVSAHRTPDRAHELGRSAKERGTKVIIAGAGKAAHLAGVMASLTTLPVIGVPMPTSDLGGLDSLLSTVQMPGGIPVATTAIGKSGAKNAGLLAVAMLAMSDAKLADMLARQRETMQQAIEQDDEQLQQGLTAER